MKKTIALILAVLTIFALCACGGNPGGNAEETKENADPTNDAPNGNGGAIQGEVTTLGRISVFVPEGKVLKMGSITGGDKEDDTQYYISADPAEFTDYYWIVIKDTKEHAAENVDMTKSFNDAEDVTFTASNGEWTGCRYESGGTPCGAAYAEVDGVFYMVNFVGHAVDEDGFLKVIGSLKAAG